MTYKLYFRYVYTFYSFDEILDTDAIEQKVTVGEEQRFTLHLQEDGSFIVSELGEDHLGKYVILTSPGKDNLKIHENEETELAYDEFFDSMGDNNHNVYEGTVVLIRE